MKAMINEVKFNSQICTSVEQSGHLLELGLKHETADMSYYILDSEPILTIGMAQVYTEVIKGGKIIETRNAEIIPAWSLHRLIELCEVERMPISFYKKGKVMIRVNHIHPTHNGRSNYNHYDSLIDCIEWLINENYFNKEYLKQ